MKEVSNLFNWIINFILIIERIRWKGKSPSIGQNYNSRSGTWYLKAVHHLRAYSATQLDNFHHVNKIWSQLLIATLYNLIFTGLSVEGALVWNWGKSKSETFLYVDILLIEKLSVWGHTVCELKLCVWVTVCVRCGGTREQSRLRCVKAKGRNQIIYLCQWFLYPIKTSIIINLSELSNDHSIQ